MRQRGEFDGHAERRQLGLDKIAPATRAFEPLPETIRQTLLKPDLPCRSAQCLVAHIRGPQGKYARFFGSQAVAFAIRQCAQRRGTPSRC